MIVDPCFAQYQVQEVCLKVADERQNKSTCDIELEEVFALAEKSLEKRGYVVRSTEERGREDVATLTLGIREISAHYSDPEYSTGFQRGDLSISVEVECVMVKSEKVIWGDNVRGTTIMTVYLDSTVTPEMRALAARGIEIAPRMKGRQRVKVPFGSALDAHEDSLKDLFSTLPRLPGKKHKK
jgi:hypothetical protein